MPVRRPRRGDARTRCSTVLEDGKVARASRRRRASSRWCSRTPTRGCSPTRSTAATATRRLEARRLPGRPARLHRARAQARPAAQARPGAHATCRAMNPGVPQDHVILPLAGTRRDGGELDGDQAQPRSTSSRSAPAGPPAMLAAKLCPTGTTMVSLEQGTHRWTYPHFAHDHDSLRYSVRYAMMVDLAARDLDVAAEPALARAADAPVRHRSTRAGPRRRRDPLVGAALALPRVPTSATARTSSSATARRRSRRAARSRTGASPTTSSSRTTTRSSGTSAPPGKPGNIRGEIRSRRQPVRGAAQPRLPEPAARGDTASARSSRSACEELGLHPFTAAGRDHLARLDRPVRQPPLRLPLLRLLHPLRLRGRREGEPAEHAPPGRARHGPLRGPLARKVLRIETGDGRPRDRRHLRRRARRGALPARRRRRRLGLHAREQPAAPALTQQGSIPAGSATTAAASARTTPTRSTRRRSPGSGRARS